MWFDRLVKSGSVHHTLTRWRPSREVRARSAGSLVWSQTTFLAADFPWVRWISSPSPELILAMNGKMQNHLCSSCIFFGDLLRAKRTWTCCRAEQMEHWTRPSTFAESRRPHCSALTPGWKRYWVLTRQNIKVWYMYKLQPRVKGSTYCLVNFRLKHKKIQKLKTKAKVKLCTLLTVKVRGYISSFGSLPNSPRCGHWRSRRVWEQTQEWPSCPLGTLGGAPGRERKVE